ncbi:DEAD/DEAH box helicase [Arthrobacter sp. 35W]|uniref:DEAD/DEAH box helicase n=1 Tax=Arthrobacter sp. 35W TaxID=1132441 RepID=UPI0004217C16|nr:DEAD/DEAH box helicase [Arthrobacter sp. 35W]
MTQSPTSPSGLDIRIAGFTDNAVAAGREYAAEGRVSALAFEPSTGLLTGKVEGTTRYGATAKLIREHDDIWACRVGVCSCPVRQNCKHVIALLFAAQEDPVTGPAIAARPATVLETMLAKAAGAKAARATSDWESELADLLPAAPGSQSKDVPPLGLQFEIEMPVQRFSYSGRKSPAPSIPTLHVRPVLMGAKGKWVRTGIAWNTLNYLNFGRKYNEEHLDWLIDFLASHSASNFRAQAASPWLALNDYAGRNLWLLLQEAPKIGLSLVHSGTSDPIRVLPAAADVHLNVVRAEAGGLDVDARLGVDGTELAARVMASIGSPAHGLFYAEPTPLPGAPTLPGLGAAVEPGTITLVPLEAAASPQLVGFALAQHTVHVPPSGEDKFLTQFYPRLKRAAPVVSPDASVELPTYSAPVLSLLASYGEDHVVRLHWEWHYLAGEKVSAQPLWADPSETALRDSAAEAAVLRSIGTPWKVVAALGESPHEAWGEPHLAAAATLKGLDTMAFTEEVLPALRQISGVEVETVGDIASYREASEAPVVTISTQATSDRDWFDLGIIITLEGEPVSFAAVFSALAAGHSRMLLPSGAHFSLDLPELHQLRELIDEARELQDNKDGGLRISRFQAGLWDELAQLGIVDAQAAEWRAAVTGLLQAADHKPLAAPEGLDATLRPYQLQGFNWLHFLYSNHMGGVLADDMGLGKTVQTLALMCQAKADTPDGAPFLVVAPTSVVGNWAAETARFAPGLRVATVSETFAKSGLAAEDVFAGADVVITSYALFRIDFAEYGLHQWSGLILDEAQFVKNHQSKAYQCARKLETSFKLAITGTPLENNLMELWTLTSIVAPGLFPSPKRFAEFYQKPIEKQGDSKLLAKLRGRVKPLMLRRTKEQVIKDLPPKQEQILEVVLNPRHQKVYQTHLQRERQKILGLLADVNKNRFTIFQSLTLLRQLSLDASLVDEKLHAIRSSKLDVLFEQLDDVIEEGHRALIFSQFTGFLGKVKGRLDEAGIEYCYLDGATRNRAAVVDEFKTGKAPVFLISLKAGGFGLNLTEADYVFILDPWWNPASEAQAVDRTHRIGQKKNVMVYRLVAKDTIEEKVMALKAKKSALFSDVMSGDALSSGALTAADLAGLFTE